MELKMQTPYKSGSVYEIETQDMFQRIMADSQYTTIVLDIYADWCVPCKMLSPKLEELAAAYPAALFCKINVELGIHSATSLPTIELWTLKQGHRVLSQQIVGANLPKIQQAVAELTHEVTTQPVKKITGSAYKTFSDL